MASEPGFWQKWGFSKCSGKRFFQPKNHQIVNLGSLGPEFPCANKMGPLRALLGGSRGPSGSKTLFWAKNGHFDPLRGWCARFRT